MSAFLGPIHHWLYRKIQLQEGLTQSLLEMALPQERREVMRNKLAEACGRPESGPLERVIDTGNIHGWLQEQVSIVEARLAWLVTELLKEDPARLELLKETAAQFGREHPLPAEEDARAVFSAMNDVFLDGMPCDRVNEVLEQNEDHVLWHQTQCVHRPYWEQVGGDIANYYALRLGWIHGMLSGSGFVFQVDDHQFTIKKEAGA